MTALVEFEDVDAGYGAARILQGVSFAVAPAQRVALLGRNGAGKSTVVNALLGIAHVTAGRLTLQGRPHERPQLHQAVRAGVAVVRQGRSVVPGLSVEDNLRLGLAARRLGPWTLERVQQRFPVLRSAASRPAHALSGGEQQMLCIARALLSHPDLLVLDEPSEGLAPKVIDELAELLLALTASGCALLLVEQNLALVQRLAQYFVMLSKGEVVEQGALPSLSAASLQRHLAV
jgi:branched-chain amino acid transport system ATP-binding protein